MNFEIRFTPEAEDTFDAIITQLQKRWGYPFVSKFETKILKSLKTIASTLYLYPVADEKTGVRKCILH